MNELGTCGGGSSNMNNLRPLVIAILFSLVLVTAFKSVGFGLSLVLLIATAFFLGRSQSSPEANSLRTSIVLSAEDIESIADAYDKFLYSPDTDSVADRTIHRPELANADSEVPAIEEFQYYLASSKRYLTRLKAHLASKLSPADLKKLLQTTDQRAAALEEKWRSARKAAKRYGAGGAGAARYPGVA